MKPDKIPSELSPSTRKKRLERWVGPTMEEARGIYAKYQRGLRADWVQEEDALAAGRPLEVFRRRTRLMWVLDGGRAGAGFLRWDSEKRRWNVKRAYLVPGVRGQRVYEKILLNLRDWMGFPLASDIDLSTPAKKVWERVGVFDQTSGRYIRNPTPTLHLTPREKELYREALNYYATQVPARG